MGRTWSNCYKDSSVTCSAHLRKISHVSTELGQDVTETLFCHLSDQHCSSSKGLNMERNWRHLITETQLCRTSDKPQTLSDRQLTCGLYSNDQMTCQLSFLAIYTAAVGTARLLLGSPPPGHTTFKNVFYLLSVFIASFTMNVIRYGQTNAWWCVRCASLLPTLPLFRRACNRKYGAV